MSEAWKALDLEGGGLQQANLRLARMLRRRGVTYALLAAFPLGLHRDYLQDRRGAWLYRLGTAAAIVVTLVGGILPGGVIALALAIAAIFDLARVDATVANVNKRLRMQVFLKQTPGAPAGFRGHYTDAPIEACSDGEDALPNSAARPPSFAEQEEALRRIAARRRNLS
jgi:hypothetical protein